MKSFWFQAVSTIQLLLQTRIIDCCTNAGSADLSLLLDIARLEGIYVMTISVILPIKPLCAI